MKKQFTRDEVNSAATSVKIELNKEAQVGPRYPEEDDHLICKKVIITRQGTDKGNPVVDFMLVDAEGKPHYFYITGTILAGIVSVASDAAGLNREYTPGDITQ